jgi:hypothetical protein
VKRILTPVVALACVGLLSACSFLPSHSDPVHDDERVAAGQMHRIANAVKDHDAAALKAMFSTHARKKAADLDGGLTHFLSAFPSGPVTWKTEGTGDSGDNVFLKRATELFGNYVLSANGKKYSLYFAYFSENDFHPDEVGLYALGVVPYEADPYSASGEKKPFDVWASQFNIGDNHTAIGDPGIYVPQKQK